MHVCVYIYIHTYTYTYTYLHTYIYIYIYTHIHIYICVIGLVPELAPGQEPQARGPRHGGLPVPAGLRAK